MELQIDLNLQKYFIVMLRRCLPFKSISRTPNDFISTQLYGSDGSFVDRQMHIYLLFILLNKTKREEIWINFGIVV